MIQTFVAQSFLLAEHSVYESLARELMNGLEERKPQRWNIVCERKEDLLSIRTQIFSLLKKLHSERNPEADFQAWTGVSLYTPDTLVRNFALTLSHNSQEQLGSEILRMLRSPFLDVVEQERMTRLLLLQLGYAGSDVAPLAKQILTLADTELPRDESFLSVLLEVQKMSTSLKNLTDIPDISLRTICVAYQLLQKMNSHFCRLQSFVGDYWVPIFKKNLSCSLEKSEGFEKFLLPQKFLSQPMLWVAAPEYCRDEEKSKSTHTYRPGNFQAHWIDALRDVLFESREMFASTEMHKKSNCTWWARTIIPTNTLVPETPSAEIHVLRSQAALEYHLETLEKNSQGQTQFLLGDINSRLWNISRSDGSGIHALTPADFALHLANTPSQQSGSESAEKINVDSTEWINPAAERVASLHDDFKKDWQRLEKFNSVIQEALNQYELSPSLRRHGITFELLLHRFFDSETFNVGDLGSVSQLPPALSLLPGLSHVKEYCVVGVPHSTTTPSFHLRILNAVFHHLRSKQIALDPIASEQAYRGYWQSFLARPEKIRFLVKNIKDVENFPDYTKPWCLPPLLWNTRINAGEKTTSFESWLGNGSSIEDRQWTRLLTKQPATSKTIVAVTAFEDYVECPLKFYWLNLHKADTDSHPALQPNRLELGHRAHTLAETFLRSVRHLSLFDDSRNCNDALWQQLIKRIDEDFISSDTFVSTHPDTWAAKLLETIEKCELNPTQMNHALPMISDIRATLFGEKLSKAPGAVSEKKATDNILQTQLTREGVRRSMKKLLQSELLLLEREENINSSQTTITGRARAAFLEQPVSYELTESLTLAGRIDRIDTHPTGDKIIDYKTSKVPKNDPVLVLRPSQLNTTNKLSVQGAIYSLAWARHQAENDDNATRGVRAFTLLRLKTLDLSRSPELTYEFDTPLKKDSDSFQLIESEYIEYARNLTAGIFSARPLLKETCKTCSLRTFCPTAQRVDGGAQA